MNRMGHTMDFCVVYQKGFKMALCFCGDVTPNKRLTAAVTGKVLYITDDKEAREKLMTEFVGGHLYMAHGDYNEFNEKFKFKC